MAGEREDYHRHLEEKREHLKNYVDEHAKAMKILISNIEKEEAAIKDDQKTVCENGKLIDGLKIRNEQLNLKINQRTLILSKLMDEKTSMEKNIDSKVCLLQTEIKSLELSLAKMAEEEKKNVVKAKPESLSSELLDFLEDAVKEKEQELECPVCLETAEVPIFMCNDCHLVCSICLPKLKTCPECRKSYPKNPRRHRYAEKLAEEKKRLKTNQFN